MGVVATLGEDAFRGDAGRPSLGPLLALVLSGLRPEIGLGLRRRFDGLVEELAVIAP